MKKLLNGILYAFVAVLITTAGLIWADSAGINVKPSHVEVPNYFKANATYASFNFYTTTAPTYYNLSTVSFQRLKPFASFESSPAGITMDAPNGTVTFGPGTGGLYESTLRMSVKANEGTTIYYQTVKVDGTILNKTFRRMSQGPERDLTFLNISSVGGSTQDVYESTNSSTYALRYTNFTSTQKAIAAAKHGDGIYYHVNEGTATPGFLIKGNFSYVDEPLRINIKNTGYDGSNHVVKVQAYNYDTAIWVNMTDNGSDYSDSGSLPGLPGEYTNREFDFPSPRKNYVQNGIVQTRINHTLSGSATHDFEIDQLTLSDGLDSYYMQHSEFIRVNDGDVISVRIGTDIPGTNFYGYVRGLKLQRIGR